jgi:hypothetical protein
MSSSNLFVVRLLCGSQLDDSEEFYVSCSAAKMFLRTEPPLCHLSLLPRSEFP